MKQLLLSLAAASVIGCTFSQTVNYDSVYPSFPSQIAHLFEHVDLMQVPNRVLQEHGLPVIEPLQFGTYLDSTNFTDADNFGMLYATLFSSALDSAHRLPRPDYYMQQIEQQTDKQPIQLLGLFQTYYSIDPDAITNSLFQKSADQLYDVPGRTQTPYVKHTTFLMAPIRQWIHSNVLRLSYNPALFFNNTGLTISQLYIDFNDGAGYQLTNSANISPVTYETAGLKDVKFKIVASDGTVWNSHTQFDMDFEVEKSTLIFPYDQIDHTFQVISNEAYKGVKSQATVNVSYACGHNSLQKPFIWVEGYNPKSSNEKLHMELGYQDAIQRLHSQVSPDGALTISDYLLIEGYDFVMVDFGNSDTYLQANALMLEEVIRQINALKHANGSREKNVTMGQSMGGMCLRYALRDMEKKGEDHETATYVSFDSAHMGVNLPLGAQYALKHIANIHVIDDEIYTMYDFVPLLHEGVRILDLPSSRTMLTYVTGESWDGQEWIANPLTASLHDEYYSEQNVTLDMPQNCERIAIVSGSLRGVAGKHNFQPGDDLIKYLGHSLTIGPIVSMLFSDKYRESAGFLGFLAQNASFGFGVNVTADIKITAQQDNAINHRIYRGNISATILGVPIAITVCKKDVSHLLAIDGPEGGFVGPHPIKSFSFPGLTAFKLNSFSFTPTASTLNDWRNSPARVKPAALSASYADKYAYPTGFPGCGFQAYAGIVDSTYEDTINQWFQNTGHTWFNTHNAPAMIRYLVGTNQLNFITALSTTYNFGKLPLTPQLDHLDPGSLRTSSTINYSFPIQNGGILRMNSGDYIGFLQNTGAITTDPNGYFRVDIVPNCVSSAPVVVSAQAGSRVEIGDTGGRTADLYIQKGATLDLAATSTLTVFPGSRIVIESGGTLRLQGGSEAIIQNEGTIVVNPGGKLLFEQNAVLTTVDQNSRIKIIGTLALGPNAQFKISRSGSNQSGIVIFNGKPKITAEPGASFLFDAAGNYDPVVQVDANSYVAFEDPDITQVKFTQCAVVMDAHANMMVAGKLLVDHSTFQGRDRLDAKLSFRSKNQFYLSTFTDLILQGDEYYPMSDIVNISNCTFNTLRNSLQGTTTYHVAVYGKGYNIHDCSFSNLTNEAAVYSEDLTLTSGISNCTFTASIGASAAMHDRSNVEIDFYHNTLSNLREGVIKSSGVLTMSCNTLSNMTYRCVTATDGAKVNLSTQSGGGYNQFGVCTDPSYWSHFWLTNSDIDMSSGANTFSKNNYHQYFVRGTLASNCAGAFTCNRNFSQNNFSYASAAPASKFSLKSANNYTVNCQTSNLYFDPACGSMNSQGPVDPNGGTSQSLQALPTYYSAIMDKTVRLDYGVKYAKDETTEIAEVTGDDVGAVARFDEIFTAPIDAEGENLRFMMNAQEVLKTAVENLVLDSISDVAQNQATFTPEFEKYVYSLNKMSDSIIDTANYREQFYLELKKVTLFRLLNNPEKALEILQNMEACGVDSAEQTVLNREKMYAQRVIAAAQYDPETDSVFEFTPVGLPEPAANTKDRYYFGSRILNPSAIDFMVCMAEEKSMDANGSDAKSPDGVQLILYPNPADNEVNFRIKDNDRPTGELNIYQSDGRLILQLIALTSGEEQSIDVSNWSPGIYQFVYCRGNGSTAQEKFVVK